MTQGRAGKLASGFSMYALFLVVMGAWALPVLWVVIASFKPRGAIFTSPPTLLFTPTLENYATALSGYGILSAIVNSAVITFVNSALALLVSVPAAYAYATLRFRLRRQLTFYTLLTQMAPPIALLIPLFLMFNRVGLLGTYPGLVLIYLTITVPFCVWILISYFQDVPVEFEESALVDGASRFTAFRRVVLPQARGGIGVAAIFAYIYSWNEFIYALTLSDYDTQTVTVAIFSFLGADESLWGPFAATGTMIMIPLIAIALIAQRQIVRGMSFGGIKG